MASFVFTIETGVLFSTMAKGGRNCNVSNTFLGLVRKDWYCLHVLFCVIFCVILFLHLYQNRQFIKVMMQKSIFNFSHKLVLIFVFISIILLILRLVM